MDLQAINRFFVALSKSANHDAAERLISQELMKDPLLFGHARQFLGISDKRAYLELSYIASRTPHPFEDYSLSGCHPWTLSRHPMSFFLRLLKGSKGKCSGSA